ncbi:3-oxoacyl-ACP reductase family protein [Methanospirillum hungatei]|uniref:3-oxoacyl-ACP reductase family protein n=1 Tax=Methanospirillum hungatei TaxID=2203 RepID=UPI002D034D88|nr:3-oxoacyl-ACP reductase family protein [Methanospirillum hungatei]HOW04169.1 3-oxoacyl-ACP reductase family protein [Methanospirillum hungatei]
MGWDAWSRKDGPVDCGGEKMTGLLENKVLLVTGGSRGIGKAIALRCADEGAKVVITWESHEESAKNVVNEIHHKNGSAMAIQADVRNEDDVKKVITKIKGEYGRLDILVNNAGIMKNNLLLMTKTEEFDLLLATNCKGPFLYSRAAAKLMLKHKSGRIINISSVVGVYGSKGQSVYSATKSFLIAFTKSLAKELGPFGITVNAIAPGFIDTDLTHDVKDETRQDLLSHIPLGRIGQADDIAKAVVFLASDLGSYVNGQILGVDGGQVI